MQHSSLYLEAKAQMSPPEREEPRTPERLRRTPERRSPLNYSPFGSKAVAAGSMRPIHEFRRLSPGGYASNILNASDTSSSLFRNYDMVARVNQTLAQQASTVGRRALATTAIYKDSPMRGVTSLPRVSSSFSHMSPTRSDIPNMQLANPD